MKISLKFVVCGNNETVRDMGGVGEEAANTLSRETARRLEELEFVRWGDVDCDSYFPNWHGGRYSHQAKMYKNERFGIAVCTGAILAETATDEDGDEIETETEIKWCDLSEADRARFEPKIWAAIQLAGDAANAVEAEAADDAE